MDSIALLSKAKHEGSLDSLISQLNRDFLRAGIRDGFKVKSRPEVVVRNLEAYLYDLVVTDFESYLTLLYTIDVSEAKIKALPSMQVHELVIVVSKFILERELLKISFKNKSE